tara:strand:+ start:1227 stop:2444 length:1218 start_codon:yes stop_codon:yes gene_type:complete
MEKDKLLKINSFFIILLPLALISGPVIPEIIVFFSFITFLALKNKINYPIYKDKVLILFIILWIYSIIPSILSIDILYSIKSSSLYFRFIIFSILIYITLHNNEKLLKNLYYVLLFSFIILFLDSSFQKIFTYNIFGMVTPHKIRISSFFGDELILGGFMIKFYPILIGLMYFFTKKNFNLFFSLTSLSTFITVIISVEKTAIIIFFIEYFLLFIFLRNKIRIKLLFMVLPIVVLSIFLTFSPKIKLRVYDQLLSNSENFNYIFTRTHTEHYISSYRIFKDNPIFGVGPKMFRKHCNNKEYKLSENSCTTHSHNFSMQLLSETGLIGFFIYLCIYILMAKDFFKTLVKKNYNKYEFLFYSVIILNLINLMPLFPSGSFFNNWLAITYSFPIGLYYYLKNKIYNLK